MRKKISIIILLLTNFCMAQSDLESVFYKVQVPEKTTVKTFNSTNEELANIESYQFLQNEKPKYIMYLMSNKITGEVNGVSIGNYKDFCGDLGDIEVYEAKEYGKIVKVLFKYADKKTIHGMLFIKLNNDILDRFLFLLPNDKAYELFNNEVDIMAKNIVSKKNKW